MSGEFFAIRGRAGRDQWDTGRVDSLALADLDAPFRTCVAAGTRILSGLSILVCTPSPFDPARFRHLWMTVRCLSGLGCKRVKTIVLTDTVDPANVAQLQHLLRPIADETEIRPEPDLDDLKHLPWRHKRIIAQEFLGSRDFDLFIYIEDDILLTAENLAYFIAFRRGLDGIGFIPSFLRCEYNFARRQIHAIDQVYPQPLLPHEKLRVGQTMFANSNFPFCAMYIFDHALARAHQGTRSASITRSAEVEKWGVIEHASLGQMFENVPAGYFSRYLIPVDATTLCPRPACIVHHSTDKYTNLEAQHGRVPLDDVFIRPG